MVLIPTNIYIYIIKYISVYYNCIFIYNINVFSEIVFILEFVPFFSVYINPEACQDYICAMDCTYKSLSIYMFHILKICCSVP